ncbi:MAG TPA: SRPBCC family protein [Opitutaceae bacterium]|nr:SRPBCC family protein [Opitutaceae bacterium]
MNHRNVSITVPAPRDTVFNFLANIENLPKWATEFCERIYLERGTWKALTSQGELFMAFDTDDRTGVIDMRAGFTPEHMNLFPVRVLALPGGGTLVLFTFFQPPDLSDEIYECQYRSLLVEMRGLIARFGGGRLCEPEAGVLLRQS